MMTDDELVANSKKVSAGRLRERLSEREDMKLARVWRHAAGKARSVGRMGEYHHLDFR